MSIWTIKRDSEILYRVRHQLSFISICVLPLKGSWVPPGLYPPLPPPPPPPPPKSQNCDGTQAREVN